MEVETMTTKEARLELRLDERSKEHIVRAAELSNESVSSFVLLAAAAAADKVLARASYTVMPADQFDELLAALDLPEEAPTLVQTGQRTRRYRRR
ncbi:MAG TPA: DUF1778 domain-containing protein [Streptosporangiaceae bacterium]|nr:DUF1778 domain-containing protein [Streptosporangiaceae bacterium]